MEVNRSALEVYVVGIYPQPVTAPDQWGIVGIFTDKETAETHCKDWRYWVAPMEINKSTGDELIAWPNQVMPNKTLTEKT